MTLFMLKAKSSALWHASGVNLLARNSMQCFSINTTFNSGGKICLEILFRFSVWIQKTFVEFTLSEIRLKYWLKCQHFLNRFYLVPSQILCWRWREMIKCIGCLLFQYLTFFWQKRIFELFSYGLREILHDKYNM